MNKLQLLTWLLRLNAAVLLLAVVPVFFPYSLMNSIHQYLGLNELPNSPITDYLTRSLSLMYTLHGAVCLALALDVKRYLPMIRLVALYHVAFGIMLLGIDIQAGLPVWWTIGEGPMIALFALFIWFFSGVCSKEIAAHA